MTSLQNHKLRIYEKLKAFFDKNSAEWVSFTRLSDEIAAFKSTLLAIMVNGQRQGLDNKGIAIQKKDARKAMTKTVYKYAGLAGVWAGDTKNQDLKHLFSISRRQLLNGPASIAIDRARAVAKALAANVSALAPYNVLPADITAVNNSISTFDSVISSPVSARSRKKTATDSLPKLMSRADNSLDLITRLLTAHLDETKPDLVRLYRITRHVGKHHVLHTGISFHLTDARTSKEIEGAQLDIPELKKTATSNIEGIVEIIRCRPTACHVNITAPGYQPVTRIQKLRRGHILRFTLALQPVS